MNIHKRRAFRLALTLFGGGLMLITVVISLRRWSITELARASVPLISSLTAAQNATTPVCRFGVNGPVNNNDVAALRIGWYIDYQASTTPSEPNGADYAPVIGLAQVSGTPPYTYTPNGIALTNAIAANPGVTWMIGNEPDRRDFQDDMEPFAYAEAYHELYYLIKTADPTAQIFAGAIVQPTPIRLEYLDAVLAHYQTTYSETMPVDGWSIHNFILNEASCDPKCGGIPCWGAGIPPGNDACTGEIVDIEDNDSIELFTQGIERFRQWMAVKGYTDRSLFVSEYGVLMPADFGFPATRVNTFMNSSFDYMLTATDPSIGNPNDGNRLVQKWAWYSVNDENFNGWLFDQQTAQMSEMGNNYAAYTAPLETDVDLYAERIFTDPAIPFSQGEAVTLTLKAVIANNGALFQSTGPITVRFFDGDPGNGGAQIGIDQTVTLSTTLSSDVVAVEWANLSPGPYQVYVTIDMAQYECNELNNVTNWVVLVATDKVYLPIVSRESN